MQVLETCSKPTALYMKLACDAALRWKSFSENTHQELRPTATALITQLFERYVNPATILFHYKEVEPLPLLLQNGFFQGGKIFFTLILFLLRPDEQVHLSSSCCRFLQLNRWHNSSTLTFWIDSFQLSHRAWGTICSSSLGLYYSVQNRSNEVRTGRYLIMRWYRARWRGL